MDCFSTSYISFLSSHVLFSCSHVLMLLFSCYFPYSLIHLAVLAGLLPDKLPPGPRAGSRQAPVAGYDEELDLEDDEEEPTLMLPPGREE